MTVGQAEYDRFGPWVIEISDIDPVPALFEPFLARDEQALICVKVPRKIERRNAHPGMHLYDYVVSLYSEELVILARVGDNVHPQTFHYRDIQYLRYSEALLNGKLRLATTDRGYDLPFNTVSAEIMQRLVHLIRQRYVEPTAAIIRGNYPSIPQEDLSFYFRHVLADESASNPRQQLVAAQAECPVASFESKRWRRLLFGAIGRTLLESLHFCDGIELMIVDRGQTYRRRREAIYATDRYFVPLERVMSTEWMPDERNDAVTKLILRTASPKAIACTFIHDNPSIAAYDHFLSEMSERITSR